MRNSLSILYLPANGIVQGMRPLVGYNYGAREHGRVSRLYNLTLGLSAGIMAIGHPALPDHCRPADGSVHL